MMIGITIRSVLILAAAGLLPAHSAEYKAYYLGGQSNMDGYGYVRELPKANRRVSPNVMIFTGQSALDHETHGGAGKWEALRPGHGKGFRTDGETNQPSNRIGPELLFGQTLVVHDPEARIAIIKYARAGSGLGRDIGFGDWYPDLAEGNRINQYDNALTTIRNAYSHSDIDGDGEPDTLVPAGIVWMQGETDAGDLESARRYQANLKRMMNLLRAAMRKDDLPVVIGKITDSGMTEDGSTWDYADIVQLAQEAFVESDECASFVTATDEMNYSDAAHYDTDGYIRMGIAFAEAVLELEATCGSQ
jgi:hypothetical protein